MPHPRDANDAGLTPGGTPLSRRVNAERLVLLSWSRAILLQIAHPLVAAGIHEHSGFRATRRAAIKRLRQTIRAMLALTFGSDEERKETLGRIRGIHRRVRGELRAPAGPFRAGTPYSAEDPDLVLWVHATVVESAVRFQDLLSAPLAAAERDAYCEEAASVAVALNARADQVPRSWAALNDYLALMYASGVIVVSDQARELGARIVSPPFGVLAAPAAALNRLLTLGTLPPAIRRQYGLAWRPLDERAFPLAVSAVRGVRRVLPSTLATWKPARRLHAAALAGQAAPARHPSGLGRKGARADQQ